MDFEYPAEAAAFRTELRAFLDEEIPSWWTNLFAYDDRIMPFTLEFCKKLAAKGWLTMAWPKEYGGADADIWHQNVVREEMWRHGEPRGPQYMNLNYIGPAIMMFGTDEQKERYIKPMAAGEVIWCQGFSEPDAGSDLAGLRTRAEDTGSGFKINGQKIWTSYAAHAEHCFLMARTNPDAPRHKGISMFLVDMETPGITVRPIESMGGPIEFHEVFFDDAEVPYDALLGPRDQGWKVAMSALEGERAGVGYAGLYQSQLDQLLRFAQETQDGTGSLVSERPDARAKLVRLRALNRALRLLMYKVVANQTVDDSVLVESAIYKTLAGDMSMEIAHLAMDVTGSRGLLLEDDPMVTLGDGAYTWWTHALPVQVAVGSSEIQRNIIAQRGLGLPRG